MHKETKYIIGIGVALVSTILAFSLLFQKYALPTLGHFFEICIQFLSNFFSSGRHYLGVFVLIATAMLLFIFFVKTFFSIVKTKVRIKSLTDLRVNFMPKKLQLISRSIDLNESKFVIINKSDFYAFSFGFISPKIVLSIGMVNRLSNPELEAVVLHEAHHLRHRHSLLFILGDIIASTLFFTPVVSDLVKRMKISLEYEADFFAVETQGTANHLRLALVHSLESDSSAPVGLPGFAASALEMRVDRLMNERVIYKKITRNNILFSLFIPFAIAALLFLPVKAHAERGVNFKETVSAHCSNDGSYKEFMSPMFM